MQGIVRATILDQESLKLHSHQYFVNALEILCHVDKKYIV